MCAAVPRVLDRLYFGVANTQWPTLQPDSPPKSYQSEASLEDNSLPQLSSQDNGVLIRHSSWPEWWRGQDRSFDYDDTCVDSESQGSHEVLLRTLSVGSEPELYFFRSRHLEAAQILQYQTDEEAHLLRRFISYVEPEFLRQLALEIPRVFNFVINATYHLSQQEKLETLVRNLRNQQPSPDMPKFSPRFTSDFTEVAQHIDEASRKLYRAISFQDILIFLADPDDLKNSVHSFFLFHERLHVQLFTYSRSHPYECQQYTIVEQVSENHRRELIC